MSLAKLIIKFTFLELREETPKASRPTLRRRHTDSELIKRSALQEYEPGSMAESATFSTDDEDAVPSCASSGCLTLKPLNASAACSSSCSTASKEDAEDTCEDAVEIARQCSGQAVEWRTTVMLRNIPNNYTRKMFLKMLDDAGFSGLYDFVYLPMDFHRKAGLGYAFVNLVEPVFVQSFWRVFDGFNQWVLPSTKVCAVSWSEPHQGLEQHVELYRNKPVMHPRVPDDFKPVMFSKGRRVPFPKPTKALRKEPRRS